MNTVNPSNQLVFYAPTQIPNRVTSRMIHYERDLPLPPDQAWKAPFVMDRDPILAARIQAALVKGPFVAEAKLGPKFYNEEPTKFMGQIQTDSELPVYGWTPGAQRKLNEDEPYQEIIVCGVQIREGKEHVYYVLAEEFTTDWPLGITEHKKTADRVYVASVQKFSDYLYNMYPPVQKEDGLDSRLAAFRATVDKREATAFLGQILSKLADQ